MSRDRLIDQSFAPTFFCGDALQVLSRFEAESVDCIVTSPAYWKQRDYGIVGQMGRERTRQDYVAALASVFAEAYRVLTPGGTAWVVLGDKMQSGRLLGLPWRFVFALEDQGWILRAEVIWNRTNAQPDSGARRRPGRAHETVFLLAKSVDHFYDDAAVLEPAKWERWGKQTTKKRVNGSMLSWVPDRPKSELSSRTTKRRRSVWSIPTSNYKGAHGAVFPEKLIEPMILSGCPRGGTVLDPFCGTGVAIAYACAHGRQAIGIDLDPDSIAQSWIRLGHRESVAA